MYKISLLPNLRNKLVNDNVYINVLRPWPIPCTSGNLPAFRVHGACGSKRSVYVQSWERIRAHQYARAHTYVSAPSPRCLLCDVALSRYSYSQRGASLTHSRYTRRIPYPRTEGTGVDNTSERDRQTALGYKRPLQSTSSTHLLTEQTRHTCFALPYLPALTCKYQRQ